MRKENVILDKLFIDKRVQKICKEFDDAFEQENLIRIKKNFKAALGLLNSELDEISKCNLYYSIGTAHGDYIQIGINRLSDKEIEYNLEQSFFYLRKAVDLIEENDIPREISIKVYTNLGNLFDEVNRRNEGIECYKKALEIYPNFAMANGNLGMAIFLYSRIIYDNSHQVILDHEAYKYLKKSFQDKRNLFDYAEKDFNNYCSQIERVYTKEFLDNSLTFDDFPILDEEERKYRQWCAQNSLFLNPLNDILDNNVVWRDIMHLPNMIMNVKDEQKMRFFGLMNEIKQEYISSRYLFYECIQPRETEHFSDRENHLIDSFDFATYSIYNYKMRMTFRSLYSILDKVAFFLNEYFEIGIKEYDVNYKSIWYIAKKKANGEIIYKYNNPIKEKINNNWGLYGIYWIYKDFIEGKKTSPNPKITEISKIRNSLEHKYLKTILTIGEVKILKEKQKSFDDKLAYYISTEELYDIVLFLLKTIRSLIINLICCINIEERKKCEEANKEHKFIPPLNTYPIDEGLKF